MIRSALKPASRALAGASIVATAATTMALLPATSASADPGMIASCAPSTDPSAQQCNVPNAGSQILVFATGDPFAPSPAPPPTVKITAPAAAGGQVITADAGKVTVSGTTSQTVTATFTMDANGVPAAPGSYSVDITNGAIDDTGAAGMVTLAGGPSPFATGSSPANAARSLGVKLTISGTNFAQGDQISLQPTGNLDPTAAIPLVFSNHLSTPPVADPVYSATQIIATTDTLASSSVTDGGYYIVVIHPGTGEKTDLTKTPLPAVLTVVDPPTISTISTTNVGQGAGQPGHAPLIVTANVSNFPSTASTPSTAATVTFRRPSAFPNDPLLTAVVTSVQPLSASTTDSVVTFNVTAPRDASTDPTHNQTLVLTEVATGGTDTSKKFAVDAAPTLSGAGKSAIGVGGTISGITFTGQNFVAPTQTTSPTAITSATNGVTVASTYLSATSMTVTVSADAQTSTPGAIVLTVTNPDGGNNDYNNLMAVTPPPVLVSADPSHLSLGSTTSVTLNGTGFQSGMTLSAGDGLTFGSFTPDSSSPATKGTVNVTVPAGAALQQIDVTLKNQDEGTHKTLNALRIDTFTVSTISPTPATTPTNAETSTPTSFTITGVNIPSDAALTLVPNFSIADTNAVPLRSNLTAPGTVSADHTTWTGSINLSHIAAGDYQVILISTASGTGTCSCLLTVGSAGAPSFGPNKVVPAKLGQGAVTTVQIPGASNIADGASITFPAASKITVSGPARFGAASECAQQCVIVPVNVDPSAPTGTANDVTITNHPADSNDTTNTKTCSGCLTVDPKPTIASFSPTALAQGAATTLTINGTNFDPSTAKVTFGSGITQGTGTPTTTATQIKIPVKVDAAAPSSVLVTVTNGDFGTGSKSLTINPGPKITSVTPQYVSTTFTGTLTISGSGYHSGATVSFPSGSNVATSGSATVSTDGTTITVPIKVTRTDAAQVDVTVTNNDDQGTATLKKGLSVAIAPKDPTNVTATRSGTSVTVAWTAVPTSDSGGAPITGYTVSVTAPAGTGLSDQKTTSGSVTFTGLSSTTDYTFKVVATNAANLSSPGATATTTGPLAGTALTLSTTVAHIVAGHHVTFGGSLSDGKGNPIGGATVTVNARLDTGQTFRVGTVTTASGGTWSLSVAPTHNATYTASYAGNSQFAKATSSPGRITVAPKVTIAAPQVSNHATKLVVKGSVAPNKAGKTVRLTAVNSHGVKKSFTATLSGSSSYTFKVKLGKGKWTLVVRIGSTSGNTAGHSNRKTIKRT